MKLSKKQILEAAITIYEKLASGLSDNEVMEEMGLLPDEYNQLKTAMLDNKADEIREKPVEHTFVEYLINQSTNIRDLTNMIQDFYRTKSYGPMVGAVRARAEIFDKILTKGQEFGLIHKEPDKKQILAGVAVTELSNKQLRKMIKGELKILGKLQKQFGEKNLLELPEHESLYSGPRLMPEVKPIKGEIIKDKEGKIKGKAKTNKVHKGRRVLKPRAPLETE